MRQQQKSATEEESKAQLSGEEVISKKKRKRKDQDALGEGCKRRKKEQLTQVLSDTPLELEHKDLSAQMSTGKNCLSRKKKKRKLIKTEELEEAEDSSPGKSCNI